MTVILNASRKFRNAHEISASGETHGGRTLGERVQPWLALPAKLITLPFNVALAVAGVATVLAVALGLVLVLILALPLLELVAVAGRVAKRQTSDNAPAQAASHAEHTVQPLMRDHRPGPWLH